MTQLYDAIGIGYRSLPSPGPTLCDGYPSGLGRRADRGECRGRRWVVRTHRPRRGRRGTLAGHDPASGPQGSAPVVQASATDLPFRAAAFEAGLAILTVHHWPDPVQGLTEMARVTQEAAS